MNEQEFDPVEAMGRDGAEIKRLRARMVELEAQLGELKALLNTIRGSDTCNVFHDAALEKR